MKLKEGKFWRKIKETDEVIEEKVREAVEEGSEG